MKKKAKKKAAKKKAVSRAIANLPRRQQAFVAEYVANGFNATAAAKTAGYSARTADSQASRLLKNAKVRKAVAELSKKVLAKREITAERVRDEIAKIAFAEGCLPGEIEPKDRLKGLELLGRYFKMFTDKVESTVRIHTVVVGEALKKERPLPPAKPEFE